MSKLMMDPLHNGRKEVPAHLGSFYASIDSGVKPEPKKKKTKGRPRVGWTGTWGGGGGDRRVAFPSVDGLLTGSDV